jgi:hypothetical protein
MGAGRRSARERCRQFFVPRPSCHFTIGNRRTPLQRCPSLLSNLSYWQLPITSSPTRREGWEGRRGNDCLLSPYPLTFRCPRSRYRVGRIGSVSREGMPLRRWGRRDAFRGSSSESSSEVSAGRHEVLFHRHVRPPPTRTPTPSSSGSNGSPQHGLGEDWTTPSS